MRSSLLVATTVLALASLQSPAAAQPEAASQAEPGPALQLRPSAIQSFTPNEGRVWGLGLGLELRHYPTASQWRWGPYAETRYEIEGAWRVSGGFRVGYGGMALELGTEHRTGSDDFAGNTAITVGKRYTWGPVGIGYRLTIPVADHQPSQGPALATRGVEHTFLLTAGWTFDLVGERAQWGCHSHRGGER